MSRRVAVFEVRLAAMALATTVLSVGAFADEVHWTITGPTSVTFDWRGSELESSIAYGTSAGSYTSSVTATNPTGICVPWNSAGPFWEAPLTGLAPATLYHYSIAGGPDHTFRTPPTAGSSGFLVIAESDIGDSLSYSNVLPIQQLMANETEARFALLTGDLTYGEHGKSHIDQHFNDVMAWSNDVAYMPAWGNNDWDHPNVNDLRNFKGRFDFSNSRGSPGTPSVSDCGEDWYWFDYGSARFIAYPEPWTGALADWIVRATPLMDEAQADPNIRFIVTFGHRPAYSSGHHPGESELKGYLDRLAASHPKYVLNVNGHSHDYERTYPQDGSGDNRHGVVHVTVGTGGSGLEQDGSCLWLICDQPSWSARRYMRHGYLKLFFKRYSIQGAFVCGPAGGGTNDIDCAPGSVIDSFSVGATPCVDKDGDGFGSPGDPSCPKGPAPDCDDTNPSVYPGAPEINDGKDNQCPGDEGYGSIDETSGDSGFHTAGDKSLYSWRAQAEATSYEVGRADSPDFVLGCRSGVASESDWITVPIPGPGRIFYYLNRPVAPLVGDWGTRSSGEPRTVSCASR